MDINLPFYGNDRSLLERKWSHRDSSLQRLSNMSDQFYDLESTVPKEPVVPKESKLSLRDVSLRLQQEKLFRNKEKSHNEKKVDSLVQIDPLFPLRASPNTNHVQDSIKKFLPPNYRSMAISKINRVPLRTEEAPRIRQGAQYLTGTTRTGTQDEELDDDDLDAGPKPHGEWVNPVFQEAMKRQQNMTNKVNQLVTVILGYAFYSLVEPIVKAFMKYFPYQIDLTGYASRKWVIIAFCIWFIKSVFNLFKGPDQCYDLPLTNKQRAMLGLDAIETEDDDLEAELELKQRKYQQQKYLIPKYTSNVAETKPLEPIDLSTASPLTNQKLVPRIRHDEDVDESVVRKRFYQTFNIDFNLDRE